MKRCDTVKKIKPGTAMFRFDKDEVKAILRKHLEGVGERVPVGEEFLEHCDADAHSCESYSYFVRHFEGEIAE